MEQQQAEIMEMFEHINEQLEIQDFPVAVESLQGKEWYLRVLEILYPQLSQKLNRIQKIKSQSNSIDQLLVMLTEEEIIEEDFLQIKGSDIVEGDIESIYYIVQLLNALIEREMEAEEESGLQEQQDGGLGENVPNGISSSGYQQEQPNSKSMEVLNNDSNQRQALEPNQFQNPSNNFYDDNSSNNQERHSVLGIDHQFEDQQEENEGDEEHLNSNQIANLRSGQQNYKSANDLNNKDLQQELAHKMEHNKQAVETGYKMQLRDSAVEHQGQNSNDSAEEDENEYFMHPNLKKYKSDPKLQTMNSGSKKSTTKKYNPLNYTTSTKKSPKHLVSHPTVKKQYRKAANPEARKLTGQVKSSLSTALKKKNKKKALQSQNNLHNHFLEEKHSATKNQMHRKKKQLEVMTKDYIRDRKVMNKYKAKQNTLAEKNNNQLSKILNWRQGQLKREKQEFQTAIQMKLQVQKENYIKKINKIILELEREKELQERNDYKEKMTKENQEAAKRLGAIENWYRDKLNMLKEKKTSNRNERMLMHTGHKEILKQIEKDLKRENQKQIMAMTMKYHKNQSDIENDLEELTREIIKVYKRN